MDQCIYLRVSGRKFIILVLYVIEVLLVSNDIELLHETKKILSKIFKMKNLGKTYLYSH